MPRTMIVAHSGCAGTPDNSMEYLRTACALDIDGLEIDVRRGTDGRLVLSHNEAEEDALELQVAFAYLRDFPGMLINCDLKQGDLELPVVELVRSVGLTNPIVFSGTATLPLYEAGRMAGTGPRLYLNVENVLPDVYAPAAGAPSLLLPAALDALADAARRYGAACLNMHYALCAPPVVERLAQWRIPISVWTPSTGIPLRMLLAGGIFSITTREPALALSLRRQGGSYEDAL